jgi:ABC-type uncharacterized transport system ATPase subunit
MANAEELCEQIVMIHKGRKVLDEPMSGLRRQFDTRRVLFEPLDVAADLDSLRRIPGVEQVRANGEGCEISLAASTQPGEMIRAISAAVAPARIEFARVRLEDVFIRLVSGDAGSDESTQALRTHLQGLGTHGVAA